MRSRAFVCKRFLSPLVCFKLGVLGLAGLVAALGLSPAVAQVPCTVPDNGTGTATLPPEGCAYLSPDEVHMIIDGLPPGTTIELAPIHKDFICRKDPAGGGCPNPGIPVDCSGTPGGSLGGEMETFCSTLELSMTGKDPANGPLASFQRTVSLNPVCETHIAPRTRGDAVQSFDTEMFKLQAQLPIGDPDFDLLRIVAGTGFGMPSPGHTTLTQLPGGNWAVDSFFDIEYRIDFIGAPGSILSGHSGSTTGTIRMQTGSPVCPPVGHMQVQTDPSSADLTVEIPGALTTTIHLTGDVTCKYTIGTAGAAGDRVDTELLQLSLAGTSPQLGPVTLKTSPTMRSLGQGTCVNGQLVDSFFDVFFVTTTGGVQYHNVQPLRVAAPCIPLDHNGENFRLVQVLDPQQPQGVVVVDPNGNPAAFIRDVVHTVNPGCDLRIKCDTTAVPGGIVISWTVSRPDCCKVFVITQDGVAIGKVPGGVVAASITVPCKNGVYCVLCVDSNKRVIAKDCCRVVCPCPPPGGMRVQTDPSTADLTIEIPGQLPPTKIHLAGTVTCKYTAGSAAAGLVDTELLELDLASNDTPIGPVTLKTNPAMRSLGQGTCVDGRLRDSFFDVFFVSTALGATVHNVQPLRVAAPDIPLDHYENFRLVQVGAPVVVVDPNNRPTAFVGNVVHSVNPPCDLHIKCDPVPGGIVISWTVSRPDCCSKFRITKDGAEIGSVPGGVLAGIFTVAPCMPGLYCVDCVDTAGNVVARDCCQVDQCPCPEDPISSVTCTLDAASNSVVVTWSLAAGANPNCCSGYIVTVDGAQVTVPVNLNTIVLPCEPPGTHEYCVRCLKSDGTVGPEHCCRVNCGCPPVGQMNVQTDPSTADLTVEIPGQLTTTIHLAGDVTCKYTIGQDKVDTELLQLNLVGDSPQLGPVSLHANPTMRSLGQGTCANGRIRDAFFDVFVDISTAGSSFHNPQALRVAAADIPLDHHGENFKLVQVEDPTQPGVVVFDPNGNPAAFLRGVVHNVNPCPDPISAVTCSVDATNQVMVTWSLVAGGNPNCCSEYVITKDGVEVARVPAAINSVKLPCEPPGTHEFCVQCVAPDGTVGPKHCCTVTCVSSCDTRCQAEGCCEPTGCNGVRVCTLLPPDQFQFDVFITLRSYCKTVLIKECKASFKLTGNPGGEFMTLQDKCRALVQAIRKDCQAAGYSVVNEECDKTPPCFTVIDATCPGARVVMGISNDMDIFDQELTNGALPDYEAETITPLCGPTPTNPPSGTVVGFAGTTSGRKIVEEMLTSTAGVLAHGLRAEVVTPPGMSADEVALMLAKKLRAMGVMVERVGRHLMFPTMMGMGAGAGVPADDGGIAGFSNDDGLFVGNFGGPLENLPPPPGGLQLPGDCNQSGVLDISDAICLFGFLFLGNPQLLPCGSGLGDDPGNVSLADSNGDGKVDLSDGVSVLSFLFSGGLPPDLGTDCVPMENCSAVSIGKCHQ